MLPSAQGSVLLSNALIVPPAAALDTGVGIGAEITICTVFKTSASGASGVMPLCLFGSSGANGDRYDRDGQVIDGGVAIYTQASGETDVRLTASANYRPAGDRSGGFMPLLPVEPESYVFASYSVSANHAEYYFASPAATASSGSFNAGEPTVTTGHTIHIGNKYYRNGFEGSAEVAEVIIFEGVKTQSELAAIYERSKTRLKYRGIDV